jgi:mRNA-degrading endonuclease RelE of RelBE toxin-antitoxin system
VSGKPAGPGKAAKAKAAPRKKAPAKEPARPGKAGAPPGPSKKGKAAPSRKAATPAASTGASGAHAQPVVGAAGAASTPAAAPPPFAPPGTDEIPFGELSRDAASAFLYAALLPDETLAFVKQLGLTRPGFRPEGLGEVERCDLLADELIVHAPSRAGVLAALRKALKEPAFARSTLDEAASDELLEVAGSDHGLAIALWRLLVDPLPAVRRRGVAALERLAGEWYGPPPEGGGAPAPAGRGGGGPAGDEAGRQVKALEEKLRRAEARAEEARLRADAQRDKLQTQLKEARAEAARAVEEAARTRDAAESARTAQRSAEAALAQSRAGDAAAEVTRLRAALREAEVGLHAAEAAAARAGEREAALEGALRQAATLAAAGQAGQGPAPAREVEAEEPEDAPANWLLPVFTPEFYDSLQGWDRRIQRAALKQAFLLSQDWRHPSLRALALEGLPGYYRVRVATDVRLIYRRGERQDTVELCSLIDREDLDRYVRQAKTR